MTTAFVWAGEKHRIEGLPDLQGFALLPAAPKPITHNPTGVRASSEELKDTETLPDAVPLADAEAAPAGKLSQWLLLCSNALGDVMVTPVTLFPEDSGRREADGGEEDAGEREGIGSRDWGPLRRIQIGLPGDGGDGQPMPCDAGDVGATSSESDHGEHTGQPDDPDVEGNSDISEEEAKGVHLFSLPTVMWDVGK
jgi:hypothetical protein